MKEIIDIVNNEMKNVTSFSTFFLILGYALLVITSMIYFYAVGKIFFSQDYLMWFKENLLQFIYNIYYILRIKRDPNAY